MRSQPEHGLKRDVAIEAAIVSEYELIEVRVEMLSAQPMIGSQPPTLHQREDPMNPGQGNVAGILPKVRGSWRYSERPRYELWPSVSNVAPRFTLARTKAWIEAAELFAITARRTRPDRVSRYFALIFRALAWLVVRSTTSTAPAIMIFPAFAASKNASSVRNGISV